MTERRSLLAAVAGTFVLLDLAQKASAPVYGHARGSAYVVVAASLAALVVCFVPRVPSRALAVAGGIACAGAVGNLVSALVWRNGVPNPIVLGDVAFNVADVCVVAGSCALVVGAALFAFRNRELLRDPI